MNVIIVTENKEQWKELAPNYEVLYPSEYLENPSFVASNYRVINLSKRYGYQNSGYYVSLLAQARGHKVFPSIMTILDAKSSAVKTRLTDVLSDDIQKLLKPIKSDHFELSVYFGQNMASRYKSLCHKLYCEFPHPMFRVYFERKTSWKIKSIQVLTIMDIQKTHYDYITSALKIFCEKRYHRGASRKKYYYDIALLYDPDEKKPPSDADALKKFMQAGEDVGVNVELITKDDYKILSEYDGLFIRETTAVNHHTYRFARKAAAERMFAIDDADSILKCTNKVYLAEYLTRRKISCPATTILNKHNYKSHLKDLSFPCILKKPDGAFSIGVSKVSSPEEYLEVVNEYFTHSDLLIIQEYMPSEFDWRIGILGNKPIYACRYYMAKNHWQIIDWKTNEDGEFDTVAIEDVPEVILKTALKATSGIGNSLYGVDLKFVNNKAYIIEVNDNPSLDSGVEDAYLGDELYVHIMKFFLTNLKVMHGHE